MTKQAKLVLLAAGFAAIAAAVSPFLLIAEGMSTARSADTAEIGSAAAPKPARIRAEGRVVSYPGAHASVGFELAGTVARVVVEERAVVKKGQVLAELVSDEQQAAVAEARAQVAAADADITYFEHEVARFETLCATNAGSRVDLDRFRHELGVARARRELALASARRLEAVLAKTRVLAPLDGVVTARRVDPGETVQPGVVLFEVADLARVRVEAEVDEFDVARIARGAAVDVTAEGFAPVWAGRVEEVPDTVVARRLRPNDPGRPSDTRALLVKVALGTAVPLKLGQRVDVAITAD